jgi:hypothetical protein
VRFQPGTEREGTSVCGDARPIRILNVIRALELQRRGDTFEDMLAESIPLHECPVEMGPVIYVDGSHR